MEIVIAFAKGDDSCHPMIPGCMMVVERAFPKYMGKTIDTKGGMV